MIPSASPWVADLDVEGVFMCWGPPQVLGCSFIADFMLDWPTDCKPIQSLIVMSNHAVQEVRGFKNYTHICSCSQLVDRYLVD